MFIYLNRINSILHAPYIVIFVEVSILMIKLSPSLPFPFVHLCHILSFLPLFFWGTAGMPFWKYGEIFSIVQKSGSQKHREGRALCGNIYILYYFVRSQGKNRMYEPSLLNCNLKKDRTLEYASYTVYVTEDLIPKDHYHTELAWWHALSVKMTSYYVL